MRREGIEGAVWGVLLTVNALTLVAMAALGYYLIRQHERNRAAGYLLTAANIRHQKGDYHTEGILTGLVSQIQRGR